MVTCTGWPSISPTTIPRHAPGTAYNITYRSMHASQGMCLRRQSLHTMHVLIWPLIVGAAEEL